MIESICQRPGETLFASFLFGTVAGLLIAVIILWVIWILEQLRYRERPVWNTSQVNQSQRRRQERRNTRKRPFSAPAGVQGYQKGGSLGRRHAPFLPPTSPHWGEEPDRARRQRVQKQSIDPLWGEQGERTGGHPPHNENRPRERKDLSIRQGPHGESRGLVKNKLT